MTLVVQALGQALADLGVPIMFGLPGSGNYELIHAARAAGVAYCGANHEAGALGMADGWARVTGRTGVAMLSQGPGVTNALTALTEAVKAHTPLFVVVIEAPRGSLHGNLNIDQRAVVTALGAGFDSVRAPETAVSDLIRGFRRAAVERRPVVFMVPLDVLRASAPDDAAAIDPIAASLPWPAPEAIRQIAELVGKASRPAILAGRGAIVAGAHDELVALGVRIGAVLAASAPAKGFFADDPFDVGISGSFASSLARELLGDADLVLAFGASLNAWTTGNGSSIRQNVDVVQIDVDPHALAAHRAVTLAVHADARATAAALLAELGTGEPSREGYRSVAVAQQIAEYCRGDEFDAEPKAQRVDPREVTLALDAILSVERTVTIDSGHFMGWPAKYLRVPDATGLIYPQAFQCVGLGLATAIGAAFARPDRVSVLAIGDGGFLLSPQELDTAVRNELALLVLVYNDSAYGAEVHRFAPAGLQVDMVQFPERDFAAQARAVGAQGLTVRNLDDLDALSPWMRAPEGPLVVDLKVNPDVRGNWIAGNSKAALA